MKVKGFSGGGFASNCYLVLDEDDSHAIAVDPSLPYHAVVSHFEKPPLVDAIVLTHAHADHLLALDDWKAATGAPILIGEEDADALCDPCRNCAIFLGLGRQSYGQADRALADGDELKLSGASLTVKSTPGHSPGSICLLGDGFLISGDTLFANGGIGRTDFEGGSLELLRASLALLFELPGDTMVYPGHGPATTIQQEAYFHQYFHHYND